MIRRTAEQFDWLITQPDHAKLAATLGEHFGNEKFARPEPRGAVLSAVRMHDDGWAAIDDCPALDESHRPLDVFASPPELSLKAWGRSADMAGPVDAYAALLISLHVLALSVHTAAKQAPPKNPADVHHLGRQFLSNKFMHREVERQEELRRQLGLRTDLPLTHGLAEPRQSPAEDQLIFNLRMLQTLDAASLLLCGAAVNVIQGIQILALPAAEPMAVRFDCNGRGGIRMKPWPFDVRRFDLQVPGKRVASRLFKNIDDFHEAYCAADVERFAVSLSPM